MTSPLPEKKQSQKAESNRGNIVQVGRDYTQQNTISFFLIGIVALGGLAWVLNIGWIRNLGNHQQFPQPSMTPTENSAKP